MTHKNKRSVMIVHETVVYQMTVQLIFQQVILRPSIMNQSPYRGPEIQNVKLFIKHDSRPNLSNKR